MERDCNKCVYHTSGTCSRWECKGTVTRDDIRAEVLKEVENAMYHEAFEVSHEQDGMQKWDSGNWIRYKLFENVMSQLRKRSK